MKHFLLHEASKKGAALRNMFFILLFKNKTATYGFKDAFFVFTFEYRLFHKIVPYAFFESRQ